MKSMFCGADGKVSMMRVSTFITTITILGTFIAHNVMSMVHATGFVSMGYQEAVLLSAALGLKAFQTKYEGGASTKPQVSSDLPTDKGE